MRVLIAGVFLGLTAWGLNLSVSTRQGVNFQITQQVKPLWLKATEFVVLDAHYRMLAAEITRGRRDEEDRVQSILDWTRTHIRPTPPGWPIVDDHVDYIIIRGYGQEDQMADLFATLVTYSGVPSFWRVVRRSGGLASRVLAFAKIQGRWTVWDIAGGAAFRDPADRLISVEELAANSEWSGLTRFAVPSVLRAQKQMCWPRFWFEIRRLWVKSDAML